MGKKDGLITKGRYELKFRGVECLNCGHPLDISDKYCPNCSQANSTKKLTIKDFIDEFFSGLILFGMNCIKGPGVFDLFSLSLLSILDLVLTIFFFSIILHAIFSWLIPNQHSTLSDFIRQLVVPVLNPIRRRLPVPAGLDFSPFIAIVLIQSVSILISQNLTSKILLDGIVCANFKHLV